MDQRRVGGFRWDPSARLVSDASVELKDALSVCELEFVRRNRLDMVRLKLEVEPRVGRLWRVDPDSASGVAVADGVFQESLLTGVLGGKGTLTVGAVLSVRGAFGVGLVTAWRRLEKPVACWNGSELG